MSPAYAAKAQQSLDFWHGMQSGGATDGWVQDLSISEDACQHFYSGSAGLVSHVTCIVVRFAGADAAISAYQTNAATFGLFSASTFAGAPIVSGSATGLGPNSEVVTPKGGPTAVAAWQHNAHYVVLIAFGISAGDVNLALAKIDARIP
jgi:hypothetical protein